MAQAVHHKADGSTENVEVNTLKEVARKIGAEWVRPVYDGERVYLVEEEAPHRGKPVNIGELSQSGRIQGIQIFGDIVEMSNKDFEALPYDK